MAQDKRMARLCPPKVMMMVLIRFKKSLEQKFQHQKIVELLEVLLPMDVEQCVRIKERDAQYLI